MTTAAGRRSSVGQAKSWDRLIWLVRERPVTGVVLDSAALPRDVAHDEAISELMHRYPSLAAVFIARPEVEALTLFRLGRTGIRELTLIGLDDMVPGLQGALARAATGSTQSLVLRSIGISLTRQGREVVRAALDGALLGWRADELSAQAGWTRAHLSVRLRARGLPSTGQLLLWAKLLHAGRWLAEPGRSAESVARQLEYSNGSVFRRALRNYVGETPTGVREAGGLSLVLRRFLDACGLGDSVRGDRSATWHGSTPVPN